MDVEDEVRAICWYERGFEDNNEQEYQAVMYTLIPRHPLTRITIRLIMVQDETKCVVYLGKYNLLMHDLCLRCILLSF